MLYEDRDFRGRMIDLSADVPDLKRVLSGTKSFHEHIGSLRVTSDSSARCGALGYGGSDLFKPAFIALN